MTCRHKPGDPNCGSYSRSYSAPATPDSKNYEVMDFARVGSHVVLKVRYPNCNKCAYEGNKVMVFLEVTEVQMMKWKEIDPHFRDPKASLASGRAAPPPAARFPASPEGWLDALAYAKTKTGPR